MILRPDQYVSWVGEFDDYDAMDNFFRGFMLEQTSQPAKNVEEQYMATEEAARPEMVASLPSADKASGVVAATQELPVVNGAL